jgi:hypothetical protein
MGERLHNLKSPSDPPPADLKGFAANQVLSLQANLTLIRGINTREKVEDGGLAGSVGADQTDDLSPPNLEADILDSSQTPKMLGQTIHLKKSHIKSALNA